MENKNITVCEVGQTVKMVNGQEERKKVFYLHPKRNKDDRPFWLGFWKKTK